MENPHPSVIKNAVKQSISGNTYFAAKIRPPKKFSDFFAMTAFSYSHLNEVYFILKENFLRESNSLKVRIYLEEAGLPTLLRLIEVLAKFNKDICEADESAADGATLGDSSAALGGRGNGTAGVTVAEVV